MFYYSLGKKNKFAALGKAVHRRTSCMLKPFSVSLGNQGNFSLLPLELGQAINW